MGWNPITSPTHHDVKSYPQTTKPTNPAALHLDLKVEVLVISSTCYSGGGVRTRWIPKKLDTQQQDCAALEPETKMTHLKVFQKLHFHQISREVTTAVVRLWRFTQWLKNAIFWRVSLPPGVCRGWRNEMGLLQMDTPWASVWTDTADVFLYMPCHVGHTKLNLTFYNPKMFPRSLWHLTSENPQKPTSPTILTPKKNSITNHPGLVCLVTD